MELFLSLSHDVFIYLIEVGEIKGINLLRLCSVSASMKRFCEYRNMALFGKLLFNDDINYDFYVTTNKTNKINPKQVYIAYSKLIVKYDLSDSSWLSEFNMITLVYMCENWNPNPMKTITPKALYDYYLLDNDNNNLIHQLDNHKFKSYNKLNFCQKQVFRHLRNKFTDISLQNLKKGYFIHYARKLPFYVFIDDSNRCKSNIIVYGGGFPSLFYNPLNVDNDFELIVNFDEHDEYEAEILLEIVDVEHVFIGKSPLNERTRFSGGSNSTWDGNSILVNHYENHYIYIGAEVYKFETTSKIVEYVSPIGHTMIPFSYAIDENGNYYLFLERKIIKNNKELNEYMQDPINDPYYYYYDTILDNSKSKTLQIEKFNNFELLCYGRD